MADMEKVIKGIQECDLNGGLIGNCPYKGILAMLKEHEETIKNLKMEKIDELKEKRSRLVHEYHQQEMMKVGKDYDVKW